MADKVLVTGACGFVGPFIIEELKRKGYEPVATDLPGADYCRVEGLECEVRIADLLKRDEAKAVMKGVDIVVHTAARMNYYLARPEYELANYHVTLNTCEAALSSGVKRFVHFSTCDTYGPPDYSPVDENHPQRPINLYAITKLLGEQAAIRYHRNHDLPLTIIRPTTVYGPGCVYVMGLFLALPVMLRELGVKSVMLPRKGFSGNLVHIDDIAGAAVFAMEKDEALGEAYNVSDDTTLPFGALVGVILNSIGIETKLVLPFSNSIVAMASRLGMHLPRIFFTRITDFLQERWDRVVMDHCLVPALHPRFDPGFMSFGRGNYDFDNAKIKSLGYELRKPSFKEGWKEAVAWYMDNEWVPRYEAVR